jgi:hypothetical protein
MGRIIIMECDTCDARKESDPNAWAPAGWIELSFNLSGDGALGRRAILCDDCTRALVRFLDDGAARRREAAHAIVVARRFENDGPLMYLCKCGFSGTLEEIEKHIDARR